MKVHETMNMILNQTSHKNLDKIAIYYLWQLFSKSNNEIFIDANNNNIKEFDIWINKMIENGNIII